MNGKVARALRKSLQYHPASPRSYKKYSTTGTILAPVLDTNENKKYTVIDFKKMSVNRFIIECVSGDRKIYKLLKRRYLRPDYDGSLTKLLSSEEEIELLKQAKQEIKETTNE